MKRMRTAVLSAGAAVTLVFLLCLVWAFVLRERTTRKLYAEYEVFRTLTTLTDVTRDPDNVLPEDDRLRGFALYRADGTRMYSYGSTPDRLSAEILGNPSKARRFTKVSFIMVRAFGMDAMRGPGGWGRDRADRPPPRMEMPRGNPARFAYIEYGLGSFIRAQAVLSLGAILLSAALIAAYALLMQLYRRNVALREREYQTKELVQLGEAARTLAHEIKNPLGVIRVQNALLLRTVGKGAEEGFRIIDQEVTRLGGLVDRIREFLRSGEGRPEELDLGSFLGEWTKRHGAGVRLEAAPGEGGTVRIDRERLAQILDNLVRNGQESMSGDGNVVEISVASRHGKAEVCVMDRGFGVDPQSETRLFEPFFTTKEKGSGIGLAISRKWAESAGGTLSYRPREGGGSVFELRLSLV